MNENSNATKRREWVKNAAIIFLSAMLVLTFFSNTIMNYSLPEVATEYVQSGTIAAKVRGTGNIEATDPYNVSINESRVISSVAVKKGDEVKKGDVLFYLEDKESTELADAQKELNTLMLTYQIAVITESLGVGTVKNIESDDTLTLTQKQQKLQAAMAALDTAQAEYDTATLKVAEINKQLGYIGNTVVDTTNEKNAVSNAQKEVTSAGQALADAQAKATKATADVTIAENNLTAKKAELTSLTSERDSLQTLKNTLDNYADNKLVADKNLADLKAAFDSWYTANPNAGATEVAEQKKSVDEAGDAVKELEASYNSAQTAYPTAGGDARLATLNGGVTEEGSIAKKQSEVSEAERNVTEAKKHASEVNKEVASKQNEQDNKSTAKANADQALTDKQNSVDTTIDKANASNQLLEAQEAQTKAETSLNKAKEDMTQIQKELLAEINLESQNESIKLQEEKVKKLEENAVGATIDAPVDGIVTTLNRVAGEKTQPEEALAVIQVAGKGFTLSFSATTEQAKKLSVGDIAEVQNSWYYDDIKATLVSIKPDQTDPAQKKQLTFNVEGDVQAGQALSLAVGQKSANYELVVPNSAIREDKNGKFILIVESKSSPLGNRYIATRIDVEVLASDDTHTAISAGLYGYEYVITTATKPVEAGKQVRLTD
ncbi:biotin/lipoyl-binding protein [Kineothrix sedimenti]|uniref:HlyD family efflux transporter periplasmic adaptor subunit n=1 Tax=Kineothrix sedimenti TaxID=3123317 RepID=A0ABZ3EQD6_9FIRM